MHRPTMIIGIGYGAWVIASVVLNALAIGDWAAYAHLALVVTGPPAALFTLYLPNGALSSTVAAGVLGWVQWVAVAELLSRSSAHRRAHDDA
jgi:hypothetical protein